MRKRLTDAMIDRVGVPQSGRVEIPDSAIAGLFLRVTSNGAKSFVVRARVKGRPQPVRVTIGDARGVRLAEARQRASEILREMRAGADPRETLRQAKREALDAEQLRFERIAERFIEEYAKPNTVAWRDTKALLDAHVTPRFRGMKLDEIKRSDIKDALAAISKRVSTHRANAALAAIRKLFNWAKQEEFILTVPGFGGLAAEKVERDRFLTFDEIRLVWRAAERIGWPFGPMFQMLLATGQRRGEVANARWASFDLIKERLWTLEPEETKADRKHFVPLTDLSLGVLNALPRIVEPGTVDARYCFTTVGDAPVSGFAKAKRKLDDAIEAIRREDAEAAGLDPTTLQPLPAWRVHDLRRTVATHMEDSLGVPFQTVAAILNHAPSSVRGVTSIYTRGDLIFQRRQALTAWTRLLKLITGDAVTFARVERILRPESESEAANTAEFRRLVMSDVRTWEHYLQGVAAGDGPGNVIRMAV